MKMKFIHGRNNSNLNFLESDKTLNSLLNFLTEGIIVVDKNGKFLVFNLSAKKILGIGSQNVSPAKWSEVYGCFKPDTFNIYPSEDLPLSLALKGMTIINEIIYIKNQIQSSGRYISVSACPIKNKNGIINGGIVILTDITDKKEAETDLNNNSERFKTLFKGYPIPSYVWQKKDDDFIFVDFNISAEYFSKNNIQKYLGVKLHEMYSDTPYLNEIQADFQKCFNEKSNFKKESTYKFLHTGEINELLFNYVFIHPDLILIHAEDVTERKKNIDKLKMLSNAIEQTADSVVITNTDGNIEYVNSAFEETTGYKKNEIIGLTPRILKSGKHDKKFYEKLWNEILNGNTYKGVIFNKKKNGENYISDQTITPIKDEFGHITNYVSVLKDITELRKQQEQEFQLQIAHELQQRFFKNDFTVPGFDIAGGTYSAVKTCGDYFDFVSLNDGSIGIIIADVCGHGLGAALIMTETRAFLKIITKTEQDPGTILTLLNKELYSDLDENHFVTLIFGRLDPINNLFNYSNAGHLPIYLLNKYGELKTEMGSNGIPLGVVDNYKYSTSKKIKLISKDILVFLTDGIIETKTEDEIELSSDGFLKILKEYHDASSKQIIENIYKYTRYYSKGEVQEDDITSIVCKVIKD